jgi:hypothetical protein
LLIVNNSSISNGQSVAKISNGNPLLIYATENPLLIVSNGISVAAKSIMDKSVAKKSATATLYPIFAVADSIAKLF